MSERDFKLNADEADLADLADLRGFFKLKLR